MTYRVLITDEYGYTDVFADGFATREQAERFINEVRRYLWHPENVKLDIEEEPYDWLNLLAVGIPLIGIAIVGILYGIGALRINLPIQFRV